MQDTYKCSQCGLEHKHEQYIEKGDKKICLHCLTEMTGEQIAKDVLDTSVQVYYSKDDVPVLYCVFEGVEYLINDLSVMTGQEICETMGIGIIN